MSKRQIKNQEPSLLGHYAGFVSRFFAVMIDLFIIIALLIIGAETVNIIISFFNLQGLIDSLESNLPWLRDILQVLTFLFSVTFVFFAYTVLFWVFTAGQTLGKVTMGVRIVAIDGKRLTFWRAVYRYIMFWIAVIPLGLGLFWVLINNERRGWHDLVAKTCVIYSWEAREDEHLLRGIRRRVENYYQTRRRSHHKTEEMRPETDSQQPALHAGKNTQIETTTQEQSQQGS